LCGYALPGFEYHFVIGDQGIDHQRALFLGLKLPLSGLLAVNTPKDFVHDFFGMRHLLEGERGPTARDLDFDIAKVK
jgi:hypothetical protein